MIVEVGVSQYCTVLFILQYSTTLQTCIILLMYCTVKMLQHYCVFFDLSVQFTVMPFIEILRTHVFSPVALVTGTLCIYAGRGG